MSTIEGMVEHCTRCNALLEIGQIGRCDQCQEDNSMEDVDIIAAAREQYCQGSDNDIEIDDDPKLSHADEGCWVAAWVWIASRT